MAGPADVIVADAPQGNWVDRYAPVWLKPWLRLGRFDRPIGAWLLMWPCWWSAALAARAAADASSLPAHLVLFGLGAFVMRGAGSTWNDFLDRDIDARVERTRNRPLPAGQVSPLGALAFAALQSLVGLVVLLQFNGFAVALGCLSLVLVAIYPLMKRFFWAPQLVLGLAFAWGALMGWAAVFASLSLAPLLLYLGGIAWCIGYDTIYGHQDERDDAVIGVRSTSRLFGRGSRAAIGALYAAAVVFIGAALALAGSGWLGFAGLAAFAGHLAWQMMRLDVRAPAVCLRLFRSNRDAGALLFVGLLLEAIWAA